MPFALSAGQPRGWASSCRAHARGGRRSAASIAVDGRAALPSGGWVAAGCHLSSSNVPGWVVSQPWWLVSGVVAFRRRFESPRAYRPAPRKRGACAADETAALPRGATLDARHTAPAGTRRFAFAPAGAGPAADFSECAPQGGHTPKNLTLIARLATHRAAGGPEATPRARRTPLPQSPRPFPVGKGSEGSRIRCGGDGGCSHRTARRLLRSWPTMISACHCRVKGRKNFPLEIFCFPP